MTYADSLESSTEDYRGARASSSESPEKKTTQTEGFAEFRAIYRLCIFLPVEIKSEDVPTIVLDSDEFVYKS